MNCDDVQQKLTAYLDGELADDRGSAIRGHLRSCAACRQVATDESALRDGLRDLPPVDPPSSLWANVQAQLAHAEVADAQKPAWKRALGRWTRRLVPAWPQLALGSAAAAAVLTFVVWRSRHEPVETKPSTEVAVAPSAPIQPAPTPGHDVTDDLHADEAEVTMSYADAAEELLALATDARRGWSADQQSEFDTHLAELRGKIDAADEGRAKQTAWRALVRYLQRAAVRDEVALASTGGAP